MEHIRIDEGVKRGRRKRRSASLRRSPETGMLEAIPADLDPDKVLQMYMTAETTSQVARELGIKRTTLNAWMRKVRPELWRAVQIVRADMRKEDGNSGLYAARDALELSRARELINSARWELQSLDPMYAPKQEVTLQDNRDLGERLRRAEERVIVGEVVKIAAPQHDSQLADSNDAVSQQTEATVPIMSVDKSVSTE